MSKKGSGYSIGKEEKMKYTLGKEDLEKIAKGAIIAVGGALLTYLTNILTQVNFGDFTGIAVAVGGIIINTCWKVLDGVKK